MIKVKDIAYVVYQTPDLNVIEQFLLEFGLEKTACADNTLYMRGSDGAPYHYVAVKGDTSRFLAFGMEAAAIEDLEALVAAGYADQVENIDAPGGGKRAVLTSPDGYRYDIVHGIEPVDSRLLREPLTYNYAVRKNRHNKSQRPPKGRVPVLRLGHCAMTVKDATRAADWLNQVLGMKIADKLAPVGNDSVMIGAFMCCDQGETYVDHHTLFVSQSDDIHIHHCAFEVQDIDAVMSAHDHLIKCGCELEVGVGRHMAGSQVFDYWIDPFGMRIEHYADGDVVNNEYEAKVIAGTPEGVTQWGPVPPEKFFE